MFTVRKMAKQSLPDINLNSMHGNNRFYKTRKPETRKIT